MNYEAPLERINSIHPGIPAPGVRRLADGPGSAPDQAVMLAEKREAEVPHGHVADGELELDHQRHRRGPDLVGDFLVDKIEAELRQAALVAVYNGGVLKQESCHTIFADTF